MKRPALLLAVALLVLSFALISYRILWLKYPILPAAPEKVWQLSMDAHVKGGERETTVMIGLPSTQKGQLVVGEQIHPGTLSFNLFFVRGQTRLGSGQGLSVRVAKPLDTVQPSRFNRTVGSKPNRQNVGLIQPISGKRNRDWQPIW
jgi:hypothetical protein